MVRVRMSHQINIFFSLELMGICLTFASPESLSYDTLPRNNIEVKIPFLLGGRGGQCTATGLLSLSAAVKRVGEWQMTF